MLYAFMKLFFANISLVFLLVSKSMSHSFFPVIWSKQSVSRHHYSWVGYLITCRSH